MDRYRIKYQNQKQKKSYIHNYNLESTKAISRILSQPRLLIFLFCECS